MQTFLPYADFGRCARVLDYRRLNSQRKEAMQILNVLRQTGEVLVAGQVVQLGKHVGWRNHPAVKMWRGYEDALTLYMNTMIQEWERRGYKNNMRMLGHAPNPVMPPWLGDERLHSNHRARLLEKQPDFYSQYPWVEEPVVENYWPVYSSS